MQQVCRAVRFTRPCLVLVHGDVIPQGPYWAALLQLVPNLVHVQRKPRSEILGRRIALVEHSADVARLEVLLEHGGMYLDIDQYVLRPLDDLRNNSVVIATEDDGYNCEHDGEVCLDWG
nr:hypothetical protein BaRGS_029589 [Batillaria attramentaria]